MFFCQVIQNFDGSSLVLFFKRRSLISKVKWSARMMECADEMNAKVMNNVIATNRGTKRKRSPYTKGPCEHGVKPRSQCKVCSACPHGRRRSTCKECGGSQICEHGRRRSTCKECGGSQICEHGRVRSFCKDCGGSQICEHGRQRSVCKECGGGSICVHGRVRSQCKECGGSQICEHGRQRYYCKECGGPQICEHDRFRSKCKECKVKEVADRTSGDVCVPIEETPGLELKTNELIELIELIDE